MASYTKDRDSALQQAQQAMNPQSELPPDIFSLLLQDQLGRDVLGRLGNPRDWNLPPCSTRRPYQWMSMGAVAERPQRGPHDGVQDCSGSDPAEGLHQRLPGRL